MIRADARGNDPRLAASFATIFNGVTKQNCKVPVAKLWTQVSRIDEQLIFSNPGAATGGVFRFPTDDKFNIFLKANCKFSIP